MGAMLMGRYGDQVMQIELHNDYSQGGIAHLIEQCLGEMTEREAAFTVDGSPFAALRDEATFTYHLLPGRGMRDLAQAYLVLVPMAALQPCPWWTGFLSMEMFGFNRPFYEMLCQRRLRDPKDADEGMGEGVQRL